CHWALHVDLDHPNTTHKFLKQVDDYVSSVLSGNKQVLQEHRMFREFVFWDTFRSEFRAFLLAHKLPVEICDDKTRWHTFLEHYAGVIDDGSLSLRPQRRRNRGAE